MSFDSHVVAVVIDTAHCGISIELQRSTIPLRIKLSLTSGVARKEWGGGGGGGGFGLTFWGDTILGMM